MKEKDSTKLLYSMGEVAEMFDVKPSLLRYWEKNFSILKPQKNKKGNRLFTAKDVENLKVIYHLIRERGMTIEGAKRQLKQSRVDVDRDTAIMERLEVIRAMLLQIRNEFKDVEPIVETQLAIADEQNVVEQPDSDETIPTLSDLFGELPPPAPPTVVENLNPESIVEFSKIHSDRIKKKIVAVDFPLNPSLFDVEQDSESATSPADSEQKQSSLF